MKPKALKPSEAPMYPAPTIKGFKKDPAKMDPVHVSTTPRSAALVGPHRDSQIQESGKFGKAKK
jgi:hypothetical protein